MCKNSLNYPHSSSIMKGVQKDHDPPPRRTLTIPTSTGEVFRRFDTVPQMQSASFTRLPLELRLRIYEELFGYRTVRLTWEKHSKVWSSSSCRVVPDSEFHFWGDLSRKCMKNEKGSFDPESFEEMVDNAMLFYLSSSVPLRIFFRY